VRWWTDDLHVAVAVKAHDHVADHVDVFELR
jgi:hypothetical protein